MTPIWASMQAPSTSPRADCGLRRMDTVYVDRLEMVKSLAAAGGIGAEIGVLNGDFSAQLLLTLSPSRLHLIDIEFQQRLIARFAGQIDGPVIALHKGDSSC